MTRREATEAIYKVINSGICDADLEETLSEVCNCICCEEKFEKCGADPRCVMGYPNYCEDCPNYSSEE